MARIGISIEKVISFRGGIQHFANTYYYENALPAPIVSVANALIDEVKANEVDFHSTAVTFTHGRLWSAGGSAGANQMITEKDLSGTGSGGTNTSVDRERAVLIQWPAGFDSRGRPVKLRKWFHPCGDTNFNTWLAADLAQTAQLPTAVRNALAAGAAPMLEIGVAETLELVSKTGRQTTGAAASHPFFEHHQLGEEWRGT